MSNLVRRMLLRATACMTALALGACVTLTELPRGLSPADDGSLRVAAIGCSGRAPPPPPNNVAALDPAGIRVLLWNIHKQADAGWQQDLARLLADADVALIQESVLGSELQAILRTRGLAYTMSSAFIYRDLDHGVVTAATVPPLAVCAERAVEPLLGIPKTALVAWFALAGSAATLAVVNVHAVNFSLLNAPYEAQLAQLVRVLAPHKGPILFAGDFNTWSDPRRAALDAAARALGLHEIMFDPDRRTRFLGHPVDYLWVRGLAAVSAATVAVTSSDHNALAATLRIER